MARYRIDFNTGEGTFWINDTLKKAKELADESAAYTQCDIVIENENGEEVARRKWYGYGITEDDNQKNAICFGEFGFYADWEDNDE